MSNFTTNLEQTKLDIVVVTKYIMYILCQGLGLIYALLCVLWLIYVVVNLSSEIRKKWILIKLMKIDMRNDYTSRLFTQKETIFRYVIFLLFLLFELIYSVDINIYDFLSIHDQEKYIFIPKFQNCSIFSSRTSYYNGVIDSLQSIFLHFREYAFSMMIWLFGVCLLHLSYAARNELKIKLILRFFLFGIFINTSLSIFRIIPFVSIFGKIVLSLNDQISLFIVIYIAKRKFFPAMNSRVIDAFHLHNINVYLQQKRLLKQYRVLVFVFLITFEIYILKYIISCILYAIFMIIYTTPCGHDISSIFSMPNPIFQQTSYYCLIIFDLMGILVRSSFIIVNTNIMYVTVKRYLKSRFCNRNIYRYKVCSDPLLS